MQVHSRPPRCWRESRSGRPKILDRTAGDSHNLAVLETSSLVPTQGFFYWREPGWRLLPPSSATRAEGGRRIHAAAGRGIGRALLPIEHFRWSSAPCRRICLLVVFGLARPNGLHWRCRNWFRAQSSGNSDQLSDSRRFRGTFRTEFGTASWQTEFTTHLFVRMRTSVAARGPLYGAMRTLRTIGQTVSRTDRQIPRTEWMNWKSVHGFPGAGVGQR